LSADRTYRYTSTRWLKNAIRKQCEEMDWNARHSFALLNGPLERAVAQYTAELDARGKVRSRLNKGLQ
jgi:hypothetical protein